MAWIKYKCGCIEGPYMIQDSKFKIQNCKCWLHEERGVATLIDCPKGRPIKVWITNGACDKAELCPSKYRNCEHWDDG
jgi:hypothetical protein